MIPLLRPTLPKLNSIQSKLKDIFKTGILTNGKYVKEFEKRCSVFLNVNNTIAVSSGTAGLILAIKCLGLKGEMILPSFTFTSGGHSLLWCGVKPVFADINEKTLNINPDSIENKITENTSAIMATHVFSNPCEIDQIQNIAKKYNLKVIYDAAHAFGSKYKGRSVAEFGDADVFSFTPTKALTTGEGGLVVLRNKKLAKMVELGRNNGDSFDREEEFLGITARMNEFSAILGIEGLKDFNKNIKKRIEAVELYKNELEQVPGISFQEVSEGDSSVYKDFIIMVDKKRFGISRNELLAGLLKRKIQAKVYFYPPLHKKKVYRSLCQNDLPKTDWVAERILSLPLYSNMLKKDIIKVCFAIKKSYRK